MGQTGSKHHETCDRMKEVLQSKSSGTFSTTETQSHANHSNKYTTSGKAMATVAPLPSASITEPISSLNPAHTAALSNIPWLIQARNAHSILTNPSAPILANQNTPLLSNQNTAVLANQSAPVLPVTQGQLLTSAEFPLGAIPLETLAAILEIYNRQNQVNNPTQNGINNLTHYNLQPVEIRPKSHSAENQQQQVFTSIFNQPENIKAEILSHLPETIHYSQLAESSSSSSSPRNTPQQGTPNLNSQRDQEDIKNEPGTSADLQQDDSRLPQKKRRLPASVLALAESEMPETSKSRRVVDEREERDQGEVGRVRSAEGGSGYSGGASRSYDYVSHPTTTVTTEPVQRIHDFELFMEAVGQLKKLEDEYKQKHEDLLECESRLRKQYELMDAQSSNLRKLIQNLTGTSSVIEHNLSSFRDHSSNVEGRLSGSFGTSSSSTLIGGANRSVSQSNAEDEDADDGNGKVVTDGYSRKNSKDKR